MNQKELREAFVCSRFSEDQNFNRPDIENWLEGQRVAPVPDKDQWMRVIFIYEFRSEVCENELETLIVNASPSDTIPMGHDELSSELEHRSMIAAMLNSFDRQRSAIYYGCAFGLIVVCRSGDGSMAYQLRCEKERGVDGRVFTSIRPVHSTDVMDAIFATWVRKAPKAALAQKFLCDALASRIAKVRSKAEEEFDQAVAVTHNGQKIVSADQVVVRFRDAKQGDTYFRYQEEVFWNNKIMRKTVIKRARPQEILGHPASCEDLVYTRAIKRIFEKLNHGDQMLIVPEMGVSCMFIVDSEFCPDQIRAMKVGFPLSS